MIFSRLPLWHLLSLRRRLGHKWNGLHCVFHRIHPARRSVASICPFSELVLRRNMFLIAQTQRLASASVRIVPPRTGDFLDCKNASRRSRDQPSCISNRSRSSNVGVSTNLISFSSEPRLPAVP